jgi:DNA-binding beta-propeller fold protein YncE
MRILPPIAPISQRNSLAKLSSPSFKAVAAAVFALMIAMTSGSAAANGTVFFTEYGEQLLAVAQPGGGAPGAVATLPSNPYGIAISADGQTLYFTLPEAGIVAQISIDGSNYIPLATGLTYPYGIAIHNYGPSNGEALFVTENNYGSNGRLLEIDLTTGEVFPPITGLVSPTGVAVSPDGSILYFVENEFLGNLQAYALGFDTRHEVATDLRSPLSVVISGDGNTAYVTTNGLGLDTVYVIDIATGDRLPNLGSLKTTTGIALLGDTLYVGVDEYSTTTENYNCPCILSLNRFGPLPIDVVAQDLFDSAYGIAVQP